MSSELQKMGSMGKIKGQYVLKYMRMVARCVETNMLRHEQYPHKERFSFLGCEL
ncbi:hypothetical protein KIN20_038001 [Parelaphostrongylus tenuis]|uniref:Uncharacterized protein n=1 Tax=Parelaphostrongylus tenuis TaxID=148309 RepID=A0AAD5REB9_PARTN|nr:hypothetical protein KIN20_038001 [Parelaphostrongylus tenuis]